MVILKIISILGVHKKDMSLLFSTTHLAYMNKLNLTFDVTFKIIIGSKSDNHLL
jgi:hypothetical protein